jgi:hypothetical protein
MLNADTLGDYDVAREYALRSLRVSHVLSPSLKTLTWTSAKTGVTSFEQEDFIFRFLLLQNDSNAYVDGTSMRNGMI